MPTDSVVGASAGCPSMAMRSPSSSPHDGLQEGDHNPGDGLPHHFFAAIPFFAEAGDKLGSVVVQHVEVAVEYDLTLKHDRS